MNKFFLLWICRGCFTGIFIILILFIIGCCFDSMLLITNYLILLGVVSGGIMLSGIRSENNISSTDG